jgi:hypothetical protein
MLQYAPVNEQEVVFLFAYVCNKLGYTIKRLQTEFPDCILIDKNNNELRTEFEYMSSHFIYHRHDISKCDMIITWKDDKNLKNRIKVIELKEYFPFLRINKKRMAEAGHISITLQGLCLILEGEADRNNLSELFKKYNEKERTKEPIRFIARLIMNGGEPFIEDGKIVLRKPIDLQTIKYSVSKNKSVLNQARRILEQIGVDFK